MDMEIAIVVVAYNRVGSMSRLLYSLEKASYPAGKNIPLIISVDKSNTDVVERYADDFRWQFGEKIVDKLDTKDRIFNVKIYEDVDELKSDILSGKTECGFIFADDFDEMVEKRKLKKTVTYISSIYTTKGEIAKETVYGAFLDNYSEYILEDEYEKIFGEKNDEVMSELLELNALYKESSSIFTVDFEEGFR